MRASPCSAFFRAARPRCRHKPCYHYLGRQCSPQKHAKLHTSLRTPLRGREGSQEEPALPPIIKPEQENEQTSAEVGETAGDGPDKPPRPKDRSNYGSAARRAGRNIKKVKDLPPVIIPPWLFSRNIILSESRERHMIISDKVGENDNDNDNAATVFTDKEWSDANGDRPPLIGSHDQKPPDASDEASSGSITEYNRGPYRIDMRNWREIRSSATAALQIPSWQRAETIASHKPHLLLYSPKDGASDFLDRLGAEIAREYGTDFLRLSPQDIAEIGGDYLDEPSDFRSNTMSSLGYDAPLLSAARHSTPPEDPGEDEEYDEYEDGEGSEQGSFKPMPYQQASGGSFGIGAIHIGGNLQEILKSMMPGSGAPQAPKSTMTTPVQRQPTDMTPELKLNLFVETLLNTPEIKRVGLSSAKDAKENAVHGSSEEGQIESQNQEHSEVRQQPEAERASTGLVVLISDYAQIHATSKGSKFLDKLHEAVEYRRKEGQKILIMGTASSPGMISSLSKSGIESLQSQPQTGPMRTIVTPIEDFSGGTLERSSKESIGRINLRHLRDMLRRTAPVLDQVAQIIDDWDLNLDSKISFLSGLYESIWSMDHVSRVATIALGRLKGSEELNCQHIEDALQLLVSSDDAKIEWAQSEKERKKSQKPVPGSLNQEDSKERLRKLRRTCNEHEKKLLHGIVQPEDIRTTFNDIRAPSTTVETLKTLTSLSLVRPDAFTYGVLATDRIPGLLLYGPPGTGKTLLARAVAKESGATVLEASGSDIYDMYVGESEKNVRAIFSLARKLTPCIVFIDEADAILGARGSSASGGNRTSHRELINQFLQEWDGMNETSAFIMVATNRPFDLDEASLRRLPRRLLVDLPTEGDREAILKIHLKDEILAPDVSMAKLAAQTPFYSGSDLKNVCVAAALTCVREEFDNAAAANTTTSESTTTPSTSQPKTYPKRILHPHHFTKALEEISASISEDMGSLSAIRKFDEKYGDRRGRRKRGGYGFRTVGEEGKEKEGASVRVRN